MVAGPQRGPALLGDQDISTTRYRPPNWGSPP